LIVAVLGAGKIGEAVARSIAKSEKVSKVIVTKRNIATIRGMQSGKIDVTRNNCEAVSRADIVILSVKAGDAREVLEEISREARGKIVISLMAAIPIARLQAALKNAKIVRSMPNIAATIGEAITAYSIGRNLRKEEIERVKFLLGCFGDYIEVPEGLMNAVTALSGSGPAYIAVLIEAMVSAGLKVGLPRETAFRLVTKTLTGTADLLSQNKMHPAELRDAVTTPAGTTIAGLYELEKGSIRTSMMNAVDAATFAAEKVAKKFEANE
jgi:pyrroline-5-carboxylate reductase